MSSHSPDAFEHSAPAALPLPRAHIAPCATAATAGGGEDKEVDGGARGQSHALVVAKTATTSTFDNVRLPAVVVVVVMMVVVVVVVVVTRMQVRFYTEVQEDNWSERAKKHLWMHFRCRPNPKP